jgi:hypothetical protein
MTQRRAWLWLGASSCLLCLVVALRILDVLASSEFSGGTVTGTLLKLYEIGTTLFAAAVLLLLVWPRASAAIALAASLFSLPVYLYLIDPSAFQRALPGEWKVSASVGFTWDNWVIAGAFALALAVWTSARNLGGAWAKGAQKKLNT